MYVYTVELLLIIKFINMLEYTIHYDKKPIGYLLSKKVLRDLRVLVFPNFRNKMLCYVHTCPLSSS